MDAAVLALIAFAGTDDRIWREVKPEDKFATGAVLRMGRVSCRMQGMVYAMAIHKGMPSRWVGLVIGKHRTEHGQFLMIGNLARCDIYEITEYDRLGVTITYLNRNVHRVEYNWYQWFHDKNRELKVRPLD